MLGPGVFGSSGWDKKPTGGKRLDHGVMRKRDGIARAIMCCSCLQWCGEEDVERTNEEVRSHLSSRCWAYSVYR